MTTVVVVPRWGDDAEEERLVRPLVRFLSTQGRVDLLALEDAGISTGLGSDDVRIFGLSRPAARAARAIARRAIGAAAAQAGRPRGWLPEPARALLLGHLEQGWDTVRAHVEATRPSTLVVCGDHAGWSLLAFRAAGGARNVVLPLTGHHRVPLGDDAVTVCRQADVRLAVDDAESTWLESVTAARWAAVGTALDLPEVRSADLPDPLVADSYVAVVDGLCPGRSWSEPGEDVGGDRSATRAGAWLAEVVPAPVVALDAGDLVQWQHGKAARREISALQRHAVVASARVAVAADRGSTFGWAILESLARGRPVVTLDGTPGAPYVAASKGGLVARDLAEVMEGVRGLLGDAAMATALGTAAARWVRSTAGTEVDYAAKLAAAGLAGQATRAPH